MNGTNVSHTQNASARLARLPPNGPAPPAPAAAPPVPPTARIHSSPQTRGNAPQHTQTTVNGAHPQTQKGKKKVETPVDPATMYESLKNRIAALEEEEVLEEEEERKFAVEAQKTVKGMGENAIHAKYIELFAEFKRMEREHAKEKQKLVKDKDAAKSQLNKANQTKTKMENLARELQKDNKRLREDSKRLAQDVEEAQEELMRMKNDINKRALMTKAHEVKYNDSPDIVVKVVCRYRAELFFKIPRRTKLSRLFNAWTDRMERTSGNGAGSKKGIGNGAANDGGEATNGTQSGSAKGGSTLSTGSLTGQAMQFIFTHNGRPVEADQSPEEAGVENGDEILAVELMDLTEGPGLDDWDELSQFKRQKLRKNWADNQEEAKRTLEEIFDGVCRERLKEVLRQYELRERHFECVIRSKELEVLLSRARVAEQKQIAEGEKARAVKREEEIRRLRKELEDAQNGQTMLIDKLITCCKEPNAERTHRLFASLQEELEKRGAAKLTDGPVGG